MLFMVFELELVLLLPMAANSSCMAFSFAIVGESRSLKQSSQLIAQDVEDADTTVGTQAYNTSRSVFRAFCTFLRCPKQTGINFTIFKIAPLGTCASLKSYKLNVTLFLVSLLETAYTCIKKIKFAAGVFYILSDLNTFLTSSRPGTSSSVAAWRLQLLPVESNLA